jgi:hypothetical protein
MAARPQHRPGADCPKPSAPAGANLGDKAPKKPAEVTHSRVLLRPAAKLSPSTRRVDTLKRNACRTVIFRNIRAHVADTVNR